MIDKYLEFLDENLERVEELSSRNGYNLKKLRFDVKRLKTLARNPYRLTDTKLVFEDVRFFSRMFDDKDVKMVRKSLTERGRG